MSERAGGVEIVPAADEEPPRALGKRVEEILRGGGIVAMPTETVYGLAARADDGAAVALLRALKGRPADAPLTWHVASRAAVDGFSALRPLARRLAERYWPGPLTLVLYGVPSGLERAARDGWTGLRLPAHRATIGLLADLDFPVAMSSANRHGEPPRRTAAEVAREFGARLALVVDGGPSRLGEASGVLRVGPGHFDLLREGLLPASDLRRTAGLAIGFACTGNTCRSPMAAAMAGRLLEERLGIRGAARPAGATAADLAAFGFAVRSMGVLAGHSLPASPSAVAAMAERGLDLAGHLSHPAHPELLRELDLVYCMTRAHVEAVKGLLSPGRARTVVLLDPAGEDIPDPLGGPLEVYRACAARLLAALAARAGEWA
ncbi:MAG: L-threonylcarbamoyladenylate synthase [Planctomycetota bacterium]